MQEELGRLMVGSALGVWDPPVTRTTRQRELEALLVQVPLFSELSGRHLRRLASVAEQKHCLAGTALVRAGAPGDAFYTILDGEARVEQSGGPIGLGAGAFFGEIAIIDGAPRSATVTAVTDVVVLVIPREKFRALLVDEPTVMFAIMAKLAQRLREAWS
jgi:CRP-like cAMP-binding protein